jgi:hypothetical protein
MKMLDGVCSQYSYAAGRVDSTVTSPKHYNIYSFYLCHNDCFHYNLLMYLQCQAELITIISWICTTPIVVGILENWIPHI